MKKLLLIFTLFFGVNSFCQDHFAGMITSQNSGMLAGSGLNPAEFANISKKIEINIISGSINISNNKVGFKELLSGTNLKSKIFQGDEPVTMLFNSQIYGPGITIKSKKWALAFTTKANGVMNLVNFDSKIGDAIANTEIPNLFESTTINNNNNQRINGTTWGEVGFSIARSLVDNEKHKFNIGGTFKLLFPASYANIGLSRFQGTISNNGGQYYLNNTSANIDFTYSGGLANGFTNFNDYFKSVWGSLNGFSSDFGINYQLKDNALEATEEIKNSQKYFENNYKLNIGIAIRNIGSMTFKNDTNYSTNYDLNIQPTEENPDGLNLFAIQNANGIQEVETILTSLGYLNKTQAEKREFTVKLPTTINAYVDLKLLSKMYVSAYLQQKMFENDDNNQISSQNSITITPRYNMGLFEVFSPFTNSDISGFNVGLGFRIAGFYLGSSSVVTGVINNSKQADAYVGYKINL